AVVACSEAVRARLVAEDARPVEVIRHGVPVTEPRPPLSEPPTVAFAGRLRREKGADLLVHAFARVLGHVPAARLVLHGSGPEEKALRALAGALDLGDRVSFVPHLPWTDLEHELGRAWVQVVPSR